MADWRAQISEKQRLGIIDKMYDWEGGHIYIFLNQYRLQKEHIAADWAVFYRRRAEYCSSSF